VLPLATVAVLVWLVWFLLACALLVLVWSRWHPRGRYALVVYSNSPTWQAYFDQRVLPEVGSRAVVMNWSERRRWRLSLPVVLFHVFGGHREYNPLAIVFVRWRWPLRFRFYRAFRSFKRGKPAEVDALRQGFLAALDAVMPPPEP
jgi:hypothetical protein